MTLTVLATITRRAIFIFILSSILGIAAFVGYKIWYANYLASLPPVEEKPDIKFGILPYPDLPNGNTASSNFSYSLDTNTGNLPNVDKIIKVYFIPKPVASLLSGEKSEEFAKKFDLNIPPEIISETKYRFRSGERNLTIDLDTGNFTYQKEASLSAKEALTDQNSLAEDFRNFLTTLNILKDELKQGPSKINLLKLDLEATAAEISLWPADIDQKPVVLPSFNKSLVNSKVSQSARGLQNYIELNFTFWPVDTSTFATYPTRTAAQALEDLKAGQGAIIIQPPNPQVSISSVYIAYFQSERYSPYLQPVFVFEGPSFAALLPAIDAQFINPSN